MKIHLLKSKILTASIISIFTFAAALFVIPPAPAGASDIKGNLCGGSNFNLGSNTCGSQEGRVSNLVNNVVNILTIIVGIVAVIMIIVAGFKYITSGGDSAKVTSSRNTIIYAIVGLIIVALAQVIVKFVLNKVPT